ncbi:MAG: hypothetical protein CMJ98_01450 [Planctomycetes bacterium]|jgi:hypothetical protein|nr:hypothetical protein [Planctomycetota bacterium]
MRLYNSLAVLVLSVLTSGSAWAQIKSGHLSYPPGDSGDKFGASVALLDDLALVGAPSSPWWTGDLKGYAVLCDSLTGDNLAVLTPSDSSANDGFGKSLAMSPQYMIVGANNAVYVFDTATRQELYKISRSWGFGHDVATSGTLAIVGNPEETLGGKTNAGAVYLFDLSTGQQLFKLKAANPMVDDEFGRSVSIHGTHAIVGTQGDYDPSNGTFCGHVHVFNVNTGKRLYKLTKSVAPGEIGNEFGSAVAIRANRILVGAPAEFEPFVGNVGAVYVYDTTSGQELGRIASPHSDIGGWFGRAIALSNGQALISDPKSPPVGHVFLYDVETRQELLRINATQLGSPGNGGFASDVALYNGRALVSDQDYDGNSIGAVHAVLFAPLIGSNYCTPAVVNSSGLPGRIAGHGSVVALDNQFLLSVDQLPPGRFGYFLTGPTQGFIPNPGGSQGNLCLTGKIGRYVADIFKSTSSGSHSLFLDLDQVPFPGGGHSIVSGESWNWTCWYRDNNPGSTSNFTDAVSVMFQ